MIMMVIMITLENLALCVEYLPQIYVAVFFIVAVFSSPVFLPPPLDRMLTGTHAAHLLLSHFLSARFPSSE